MPHCFLGPTWYVFVASLFLCGFDASPCHAQSGEAGERTADFIATERYYHSILGANRRAEPNLAALNQFFTLMPKGGDLHHHYSGAIYAETFLDWAQADGYWINRQSLKIETTKSSESLTVEALRGDERLYRQLLSLWSDKDFDDHYHDTPPPDEQFFKTFGYFGALAARHIPEGLQKLKQRARQQNVQYLETMLASVPYSRNAPDVDNRLWELQKSKSADATLKALSTYARQIAEDPKFTEMVNGYVHKLSEYHQGLDDDHFTMRYQTYVYRDMAPSLVFASLYAGFQAAQNCKLLVGVNILGPENGVVALRDYWLHMYMFQWLREKYPQVRVAMHAGELTLGMVRPEDLTFHIRDAIRIAGADRIGHGVDIVYEPDSLDLMQEMIEKQIAVEINLTSNEFILGVSHAAHPVTVYLRHGVPLVISTDDPGVSRNDLASQYRLLAARYKLSYADIKRLVFNSIRYSFLDQQTRQKMIVKVAERYRNFERTMAQMAQGMGN